VLATPSPRIGVERAPGLSVPPPEIGAARLTALHWILRVACAACFVGHGAFGIITKMAWVPYFGVWGIPELWAWRLMPVVGAVDIGVGALVLFVPVRAALLCMTFWGFQTACLRPLTGEPIWELLERGGNYGVSLAFLVMLGAGRSLGDWFSSRRAPPLTANRTTAIAWILRVTAAILLIGHGGFGFAMRKSQWAGYFEVLGIGPVTVKAWSLTPLIGWFECVLGLVVLAVPVPPVLIIAFVWKVGTELLRPLAGEPFWEFIERGGSYAAPLALLVLAAGPGPQLRPGLIGTDTVPAPARRHMDPVQGNSTPLPPHLAAPPPRPMRWQEAERLARETARAQFPPIPPSAWKRRGRRAGVVAPAPSIPPRAPEPPPKEPPDAPAPASPWPAAPPPTLRRPRITSLPPVRYYTEA
jgi:hypothetical protein